MPSEKNPIKLVKFSQSDYQPTQPPAGFGPPSYFKEVTTEFRSILIDSIDHVLQSFSGDSQLLGVAVVTLEEKAIAKSHRPTGIFNDRTCPFIGDVGFGKFLIQVDYPSLDKLAKRIRSVDGSTTLPQLSTIKSIEPYVPEVNVNEEAISINIRLFRFNTIRQNTIIDELFESFLKEMELDWKKLPFEQLRIYKVFTNDSSKVESLAKFNAVSRITASNSIKLSPMVLSGMDNVPVNVSNPDPDIDYPVVGVVDTGVKVDCPCLAQWVAGVEQYVVADRDLFHGTFVSGLITNARSLNGGDLRFPASQSKIFSVEVLDKDGGSPDEVLFALDEMAIKHPEIKVWNLSLGSKEPVSQSFISDFAVLLDAFQEKHNCLCIVSAGNYEGMPYRPWPPVEEGLQDGISSPGDSVRSITVGSLAHVDGFVKNDEPSHFSRRGPVSNYMQKPEVVHYGGNAVLDVDKPYTLGVNSISDNCQLADNIGTSFSAPIVSTVAANIFHQIGDSASPYLVKALMIHSASLNNDISGDAKHFYGWGVPADADDILTVSDHEMTFVMTGQAMKSQELQKLPFPIPESLRTSDGKVRGEFFITLVYDTPLQPQNAYEYCQVNLNVGLGKFGEDGKFKGMVPQENSGYEFEKDLVSGGGKWSPVKVYKKRFPKGADVENWKLKLELMNRDGYEPEGVLVPFALVITLRDIDGEAPIYNEMSRLMEEQNWEVSNLVIKPEIQV